MKQRILVGILLGTGLAACEQQSQSLPFNVDSAEPTVKTVSQSEAARVTTPGGASVHFPSGSVGSNTSVSLSTVTAPAAAAKSGTSVSSGFKLEPAGLELEKPASAELKFAPPSDAARAWLASVVNITPDGIQEIGNTRLDLRSGLADARVGTLGTLAVVIPDPSAVVLVQRSGAARSISALESELLPTGTDSVATECGDVDNRCADLSAAASENLLTLVEDAAAVYPRITGKLRISGVSATGEFNMATTLRLRLKSGASAENVDFAALIRPTSGTVVTETASEIRMTNVYFRISGGTGDQSGSHETIDTLVIPKGSSNGSITITRHFEIRNSADQLEDSFVKVTFPIQFYQ